MKISRAGLDFIKGFETLQLIGMLPTPNDVPTAGWGHTGPDVTLGTKYSLAQCDAWLIGDLARAEDGVNRLVKVPLTQGQFDALVSFAFNVGTDIDADDKAEGLGDSTLLCKLNAGDYAGAAAEFSKWNKQAGKVLNGLTRRRAGERAMFEGK